VANLSLNSKFDDTIFTNQGFFILVVLKSYFQSKWIKILLLIEFVLINEMIELLVNVVGYK